ncbi:hypothetical protein LguiA_010707 [Lonicera macranthoides]
MDNGAARGGIGGKFRDGSRVEVTKGAIRPVEEGGKGGGFYAFDGAPIIAGLLNPLGDRFKLKASLPHSEIQETPLHQFSLGYPGRPGLHAFDIMDHLVRGRKLGFRQDGGKEKANSGLTKADSKGINQGDAHRGNTKIESESRCAGEVAGGYSSHGLELFCVSSKLNYWGDEKFGLSWFEASNGSIFDLANYKKLSTRKFVECTLNSIIRVMDLDQIESDKTKNLLQPMNRGQTLEFCHQRNIISE